MKKLLLSFATVAIAVASAASNTFKVTIDHPTWVGGTELKAGEYKVQTEGDKITLTMGKSAVHGPGEGRDRHQEIRRDHVAR